MDFRKNNILKVAIYNFMIALQMLQAPVSCQVSLMGNYGPQDYIIEGTVFTLNCTVVDNTANNSLATIIEGSPAIFNCPNVRYPVFLSDRIYLNHFEMASARGMCGDCISGRITKVELNGTVYIAQINITTTIAMNGGFVECRERKRNDTQRIMMPNIIALLGPLAVKFPHNATFVIYWNQANEGASQISHYSTSVTGENCGECTNLGIVSNVINQLSCTGWEPNGQVCNVTVTAFASVQQLNSSRLATVYLQTPKAPILEDIIPVYSYDREELQSMEIFLAVDSTVDPNGLSITFQVNVERSSQDANCSFNFSAKSKCITTDVLKYRCKIDFTVRRCSQLHLQQQQQVDYQIRLFAETSIGRSPSSAIHRVLAYANLTVRLLFEPQQVHKEFSYISIIFPQINARVTSMIKYGPNCQVTDNRATIVGFNVTTLTFSVPVSDNIICCIVSIFGNNTFESLAIQGTFSNEGLSACDMKLISIPVAMAMLVFTVLAIIVLVIVLVSCKKTQGGNEIEYPVGQRMERIG